MKSAVWCDVLRYCVRWTISPGLAPASRRRGRRGSSRPGEEQTAEAAHGRRNGEAEAHADRGVQLQVQLVHVTGRIGDRRDVLVADDGGDDRADGPGDLGGLAALPPEATMPQAPTSRPRTSVMTPSPSVQAAEIVPTDGAIAVAAQGRRAPTRSRAHAPSRMWKPVPVLTRPPSPFLAGGGGGGAAPGWMVPMGSPLSGGAGCPRRPPPSAGTSGRECLMSGGALERLAAEGPAPARGRLALNGETVPALRAWWPGQL
jgi:hypothetical protein